MMPEPYAQDDQKLVAVAVISPLPLGASSAVAASADNVTIIPPSDKTAYVTGFEITGGGVTTAAIIAAVLSGLGISSMTFDIGIPAGAAVGVNFQVQFATPIPSSGKGQGITLSVPSFGAGNLNAAVNLHGFAA
jgi:hypothetical protein